MKHILSDLPRNGSLHITSINNSPCDVNVQYGSDNASNIYFVTFRDETPLFAHSDNISFKHHIFTKKGTISLLDTDIEIEYGLQLYNRQFSRFGETVTLEYSKDETNQCKVWKLHL